MKKPRSTTLCPTRGWSVQLEGLGPEIRSIHFSEFKQLVRQRLEANGRDEHGWWEETQDLMCEQRPDIECEDDEELPSRAVTGADVRRYFRTIYTAWKDGAAAVTKDEQARRAAICMACPNKGHVSCFGGCGAMASALSEMIVGEKADNYPDLHKVSCLSCGCELTSLILFPIEVLHKVDEQVGFLSHPYHPTCWKLPENQPPNSPNPPDSSPHPEDAVT